jgi:hypothetical protein
VKEALLGVIVVVGVVLIFGRFYTTMAGFLLGMFFSWWLLAHMVFLGTSRLIPTYWSWTGC